MDDMMNKHPTEPTPEMIEKIARAIFFRGEEEDDVLWEHTQAHHRDLAREQARASYLAMKALYPDFATRDIAYGWRGKKNGDPAHDAVMEDLARRIDDE